MEEIYKIADEIKREILFDAKFKDLDSIYKIVIAECVYNAYVTGAKKYQEFLMKKHCEKLGII